MASVDQPRDKCPSIDSFAEQCDRTSLFCVNGAAVRMNSFDPGTTLLEYLRGIGLTGAKLGCGEGGCGSCTVIVEQYERDDRLRGISPRYLSVVACLTPLAFMDGKHIITTEYLGSTEHPDAIQERIAYHHGSQCGFCSPGMVMSLFSVLGNSERPTPEEVEEAFDGNLCRCTGYRPILNAAHSLLKRVQPDNAYADNLDSGEGECCMQGDEGPPPGGCCRSKSNLSGNGDPSVSSSPGNAKEFAPTPMEQFTAPNYVARVPNTNLIFPPVLRSHQFKPLAFGTTFVRPVTLEDVLWIKHSFPNIKLIAGGIATRIQDGTQSVFIGGLPALREYSWEEEEFLSIGAGLTFTELGGVLKEAIKHYGPVRSRPFEALCKHLKHVATIQIRNMATTAGNLVSALPNSDIGTFLIASRSTLLYRTYTGGSALLEMDMKDFFAGEGATKLPQEGVIVALRIPCAEGKHEFIRMYKQAKRKYNDLATVNAGLRVSLDDLGVVKSANLVFGGVSSRVISATNTMRYLEGKQWGDEQVLELAMDELTRDFDSNYSSESGMQSYRRSLMLGFFYRFWYETVGTEEEKISVGEIERDVSSGNRPWRSQKPRPAALNQTTGEAHYTDDIPPQNNEVYGHLVLSKRPHAKIIKVDYTSALELTGVIAYIDHRDLPKSSEGTPDPNMWGHGDDYKEPFFAVDEVLTAGQVIGMIIAKSRKQAQVGAEAVTVDYEDKPAILTIEEAIDNESFFKWSGSEEVDGGRPGEGLRESARRIKGTTRIGGQEHFYLETIAVLVVPKLEEGEIEVFSSTQNPTEVQANVAQVTGVSINRVVVKVRRLGGGFGGKDTRSIPLASICAVAAKKLNRPVRCMLSRKDDMISTGQRHAFYAKWEVGVTDSGDEMGKITALEVDIYTLSGWSLDLSRSVCRFAMDHIDNCYKIPNLVVRGNMCKTNTLTGTSFRGFGASEAMFITESFIEEIADHLEMPSDKIREINMYKEGDVTRDGKVLKGWHVPTLAKELKDQTNYSARCNAVKIFNAANKYKKKGLSLIPTKFCIPFPDRSRNQAGALVHIHPDGSVLVAHGGIEMGQGLYTKTMMTAASQLNVPIEDVFSSETATNTVANTFSSSSSTATDINSFAVYDACKTLNERLLTYRILHGPKMKNIAAAAHNDRVNLTANGFYGKPESGKNYSYFTQGVCLAEVEIDTLTGDWTCISADLRMDVGKSINKAIDWGQITGAFIQGQGLFTTEEVIWNGNGQLRTVGPGEYKIPGARDIPQVFNVTTTTRQIDWDWPELNHIHASKGVGEAPLFLGSSVFFAIRDALKSVRADNGVQDVLSLVSPATPERIRLACGDKRILNREARREGGEDII